MPETPGFDPEDDNNKFHRRQFLARAQKLRGDCTRKHEMVPCKPRECVRCQLLRGAGGSRAARTSTVCLTCRFGLCSDASKGPAPLCKDLWHSGPEHDPIPALDNAGIAKSLSLGGSGRDGEDCSNGTGVIGVEGGKARRGGDSQRSGGKRRRLGEDKNGPLCLLVMFQGTKCTDAST